MRPIPRWIASVRSVVQNEAYAKPFSDHRHAYLLLAAGDANMLSWRMLGRVICFAVRIHLQPP